jgi:hypothetical protein
LPKLYIAILVAITLCVIAVGNYAGAEPAGVAVAIEKANRDNAMAAAAHAAAASHRIARAKCAHLGGVDRGNCRTEARAEAKRASKAAPESSAQPHWVRERTMGDGQAPKEQVAGGAVRRGA